MAKKNVDQDAWKNPSGKVFWRTGTKEPWIELRVVLEDGTEKKFIARPIREFYSERGVRREERAM